MRHPDEVIADARAYSDRAAALAESDEDRDVTRYIAFIAYLQGFKDRIRQEKERPNG
jgi:hypothetical protein